MIMNIGGRSDIESAKQKSLSDALSQSQNERLELPSIKKVSNRCNG